jgi:hypothetical protein
MEAVAVESSRRWKRIALLLALAAMVSLVGRFVLDWAVSLVPEHSVWAERIVATAFVCVLIVIVVKPLLEELGVARKSKASSKSSIDGEP